MTSSPLLSAAHTLLGWLHQGYIIGPDSAINGGIPGLTLSSAMNSLGKPLFLKFPPSHHINHVIYEYSNTTLWSDSGLLLTGWYASFAVFLEMMDLTMIIQALVTSTGFKCAAQTITGTGSVEHISQTLCHLCWLLKIFQPLLWCVGPIL